MLVVVFQFCWVWVVVVDDDFCYVGYLCFKCCLSIFLLFGQCGNGIFCFQQWQCCVYGFGQVLVQCGVVDLLEFVFFQVVGDGVDEFFDVFGVYVVIFSVVRLILFMQLCSWWYVLCRVRVMVWWLFCGQKCRDWMCIVLVRLWWNRWQQMILVLFIGKWFQLNLLLCFGGWWVIGWFMVLLF